MDALFLIAMLDTNAQAVRSHDSEVKEIVL